MSTLGNLYIDPDHPTGAHHRMTPSLARHLRNNPPTWRQILTYLDDQPIMRKAIIAEHRAARGFKPLPAPMLAPPSSNLKTNKATLPEYSHSLAQADTSGTYNTCDYSTPSCRAVCVGQNGNGAYPSTQRGRAWKVDLWANHPAVAAAQILADARAANRRHPTGWWLRLNTLSDIPWEDILPSEFFDTLSTLGCQYTADYTKNPNRSPSPFRHLAFSLNERRPVAPPQYHAVAVVISDKARALGLEAYADRPTVDADLTDEWITSPTPVAGVLSPKGRARNITPDPEGFVRP